MEPILSAAQQESWNRNSYLFLPGFFAHLTADMQQLAEEMALWPESSDKWLTFYEAECKSVLSRRENIAPYHALANEILNGKATLDVVSELMGEEAVLYKDRVNFKFPGGGPHSAHQDGVAYEQGGKASFDVSAVPYVSILVSIDDATRENGCLEVVPGWALDNDRILEMERPDPTRPSFSKIKDDIENQLTWLPLPTVSGDVLFFTERLPHRSAANNSQKKRAILYGVYNPSSEGDKRESYFASKRSDPNNARYLVGNPHAPV